MKTKQRPRNRQCVSTQDRRLVYPTKNVQRNTIQYLKHLKFQTDKKFVDITLTASRRDEIDKCHQFVVVPWYFSVNTKFFKGIKSIHHRIIKDIHYAFKNGKKNMTISKNHYNENDFKVLEDFGIKYRTVKYRVFLR